jgi:adenine deaminase
LKLAGHIIDIPGKRIFKGEIEIEGTRLKDIRETDDVPNQFILPGFIDAHVHIESSMIVPSEFARLAVVHGTVGTVSDPHEIGNVLGLKGVEYMITNGAQVPFKFFFGAPSCVPATSFETAGAAINEDDVEVLLQRNDVYYLAEMMNWPGVLNNDPVVKRKIAIAEKYNKVVDGHAPGLRGEQASRYAAAGITTDHECFTAEEAVDKLKAGMKILVREGSAAKNFEALIGLAEQHSDQMMFCSDDKHPDSLEEGHIDLLVKRALAKGIDLFKVLQMACINPIDHYKLPVGKLRKGDAADFICVNNLKEFRILKTFIDGKQVSDDGKTKIERILPKVINHFQASEQKPENFSVRARGNRVRVIEALDGQLVTNELHYNAKVEDGELKADPENDVLKLAVVNRYIEAKPAVAFIKNFGLKRGAIASSVAHDSHNIIAVGVNDASIAKAVNLIIRHKGGVAAVDESNEFIIPLPIAGIMSDDDGYKVAQQYKEIDALAKQMGSTLKAPFMTLSFMALLVIPALKLSDKGLFEGAQFRFTDVFVSPPKDPLHGKTLEMIMTELVEHFGWEDLGSIIDIRCFRYDPSIKSSLTFLRKTPWARKKVEELYISIQRD